MARTRKISEWKKNAIYFFKIEDRDDRKLYQENQLKCPI